MNSVADLVIVNWNAGPLLRDCVRSIAAHGGDAIGRVIVVDNGSTDGSAELEGDAQIARIEVIRAGRNLGFSRACNLGARRSDAPYLLFLNPDARLLPGGLQQALRFMESPDGERVGVCGIRLIAATGEVQRHCARFPSWRSFLSHSLGLSQMGLKAFPSIEMHDFDHRGSRDVDHVIGAFYLIRRDLFEELGGFDEAFFVYLEDLDLSLRVRRAGWRVHYLAEAEAVHLGGGTSAQIKARRLFYSLRSRFIYVFKHFSPAAAWVVVASTLLIEPLTRLARALLRRSWKEGSDTLRAYGMLLRNRGEVCRMIKVGRHDKSLRG